MKARSRNTIFKLEPWGTDIMVSIGETVEQVRARIQKSVPTIDQDDLAKIDFSNRRGFALMLSGGQTVLWLKGFNGNPDSISTLAHEAFHATCFVMNSAGVDYSDSSEEAFAYTLDWLVKKILVWLGDK